MHYISKKDTVWLIKSAAIHHYKWLHYFGSFFLVMKLSHINIKVGGILHFLNCDFHYSFKYFIIYRDILGKVINTWQSQKHSFPKGIAVLFHCLPLVGILGWMHVSDGIIFFLLLGYCFLSVSCVSALSINLWSSP